MESKSISAIIGCDLYVQQHKHGISRAYWRWYGVSLLSEPAAIPTEMQHYPFKQTETRNKIPLFFASAYNNQGRRNKEIV